MIERIQSLWARLPWWRWVLLAVLLGLALALLTRATHWLVALLSGGVLARLLRVRPEVAPVPTTSEEDASAALQAQADDAQADAEKLRAQAGQDLEESRAAAARAQEAKEAAASARKRVSDMTPEEVLDLGREYERKHRGLR